MLQFKARAILLYAIYIYWTTSWSDIKSNVKPLSSKQFVKHLSSLLREGRSTLYTVQLPFTFHMLVCTRFDSLYTQNCPTSSFDIPHIPQSSLHPNQIFWCINFFFHQQRIPSSFSLLFYSILVTICIDRCICCSVAMILLLWKILRWKNNNNKRLHIHVDLCAVRCHTKWANLYNMHWGCLPTSKGENKIHAGNLNGTIYYSASWTIWKMNFQSNRCRMSRLLCNIKTTFWLASCPLRHA